MGPPLGTAHAEAQGLRLRGPLPSRSSSSVQPHTHTPRPLASRQVPLWVESQKHRMSEIEKARVLSGTPPHPLNAHLSLRTFWISDRPLCKHVHWTLGKCRPFIQSQDEQLSSSLQIESEPSSRQHAPRGMKQKESHCDHKWPVLLLRLLPERVTVSQRFCSQLPTGGAVQRRTTGPRAVCPSEDMQVTLTSIVQEETLEKSKMLSAFAGSLTWVPALILYTDLPK